MEYRLGIGTNVIFDLHKSNYQPKTQLIWETRVSNYNYSMVLALKPVDCFQLKSNFLKNLFYTTNHSK